MNKELTKVHAAVAERVDRTALEIDDRLRIIIINNTTRYAILHVRHVSTRTPRMHAFFFSSCV